MAITLDITIEKGASWTLNLTAVGIDLTGGTGKCQIRKYSNQDSPVVAEPVVALVTPASGIYSLTLTEVETLAIPTTAKNLSQTDTYIYDVLFTVGSLVYKTHQGVITIKPLVTY